VIPPVQVGQAEAVVADPALPVIEISLGNAAEEVEQVHGNP
jgi:hypothetical protein